MPQITTRITSAQDATVKGTPLTNAEIDQNFININDTLIMSGDLTGFLDKSQSTLSFNTTTRVLTIAPVSTSYVVYYKGKKITISQSLSLTVSNGSGGRYITLNPTTLLLQDSGASIALSDYILVAYVYWDTISSTAVIFGDERHSSQRDTLWHTTKHNETGATWLSGGDVTYTTNNSNAVGLTLSDITIADEDLKFNITHSTTPNGYYQQVLQNAQIPTVYLNGITYTQTAASVTPWVAGTSTARINVINNGSGSLSDAGEGTYVNYWIVATNDMVYPIKAVMGRTAHTTLLNAYQEVLLPYDLPFEEIVVLYQVTLNTNSTYTGNSSKVQISSVRKISGSGDVSNVSNMNGYNHSGFSNLSSDDHLQYVHISNSRTITAAHTFNGIQTFNNGIKIPNRPTVNIDGSNRQYVDQQSLIMSLMLS